MATEYPGLIAPFVFLISEMTKLMIHQGLARRQVGFVPGLGLDDDDKIGSTIETQQALGKFGLAENELPSPIHWFFGHEVGDLGVVQVLVMLPSDLLSEMVQVGIAPEFGLVIV